MNSVIFFEMDVLLVFTHDILNIEHFKQILEVIYQEYLIHFLGFNERVQVQNVLKK